MTNQWTNWQRRLAKENLPIHDAEVDSGYWRIKRKDKATGKSRYVAAAFWRNPDGTFQGVIDGQDVDERRASEQWMWAVENPITEAEFRKVEAGGDWSDMHVDAPAPNGRGIGDNSGTVDEAELIREQIASATAGAAAYAEIKDDATLVRAQTLRSRLLELSSEADAKREALKRPHFEAGKAIDATWQPMVKSAKAVADTIRAAMAKWETAKLKVQREAQEKIDAANRAAVVADAKANKPPPAPIAPPPPPAPTTIKGASGKAAHVGTIKVVTGITDQDALYRYLHDESDLQAVMLTLARKYVKLGNTVPGVTVEDQADVR